jgi:hypothetical protein
VYLSHGRPTYAATPNPCASACAPFKNSPGTYDTCCKTHVPDKPKPAAPKAKPAPGVKPVSFTFGSPFEPSHAPTSPVPAAPSTTTTSKKTKSKSTKTSHQPIQMARIMVVQEVEITTVSNAITVLISATLRDILVVVVVVAVMVKAVVFNGV